MSKEVATIAAALAAHLRALEELGVQELGRRSEAPVEAEHRSAPLAPAPRAPFAAPDGSKESRQGGDGPDVVGPDEVVRTILQEDLFAERSNLTPDADRVTLLATLRTEEIGECVKCRLASGRKTIVFGSGNPAAALMFVGEAPGADEDAQGLPFVGKAGQLLTKMIGSMVVGGRPLAREEVYIANIIKCRPPGNRDPEPDEIAACEGFLFKQIAIIRPRVIIALGAFAARTLLHSKAPISALRGRFHEYRGTLLMPTFHPAYVLRNYSEQTRRTVYEDLKKAAAQLEPPRIGA